MSNINMFSLPHPVLGIDDDFKTGGFSVKPIVYLDSVNNELTFDENNSVEITNQYIKSLYDEGYVSLAYKIVCSATLFSQTYYNVTNFSISVDLLSKEVELEIFLIANKQINNYRDESFNDDYFILNPLISFNLKPNQIVAVGGSVRIPLEEKYLKAASLFKFTKTSADNPLDFDCSDSNIQIIYPYEVDQLDMTKVMPIKAKHTFFNLTIIPALTYAFQLILNAYNENNLDKFLEENDWAFTLTYNYPDYINNIDRPQVIAQNYLKKLISDDTSNSSPIIHSFNEINKLKKA